MRVDLKWPEDLVLRVDGAAAREGVSRSAWLRDAAERALGGAGASLRDRVGGQGPVRLGGRETAPGGPVWPSMGVGATPVPGGVVGESGPELVTGPLLSPAEVVRRVVGDPVPCPHPAGRRLKGQCQACGERVG